MRAGATNKRGRDRRGIVAVVMVAVLLLVNLIIVGSALSGARDQDLSVRRLETVQAFYAAEAGANMAIREMMFGTDDDGDTTVGSVSDDGNDANDPSLGSANVVVTLTVAGSQSTLKSTGRAGSARRTIEVTGE